jgi:hypothetical protein
MLDTRVNWLVECEGVTIDSVRHAPGQLMVNVSNPEDRYLTEAQARELVMGALVHLGPTDTSASPVECAAIDLCKLHMQDLEHIRFDFAKLHIKYAEAMKENGELRGKLAAAHEPDR